jgi:hypothetical protein
VEQRSKLQRVRANEAISLATQGRWQDAVVLNREILDQFPDDVEALNRLGKALAETGRYSEARKALERSLEISPTNSIARKNLERMAGMEDAPIVSSSRRVVPQVFLEESGKSITTALVGLPSTAVLGQVHNGDVVQLDVDGHTVAVQNRIGQHLGRLEPKLASRIIKLQGGGNKYVAAVASVRHDGISVVVRETYQSAKMNGVVSFPPTGDTAPSYLTDMDMGLDDDVEFDAMASWSPLTEDSVSADDAGDDPPASVKPQRASRALHDEEVEDEEDEEIRV